MKRIQLILLCSLLAGLTFCGSPRPEDSASADWLLQSDPYRAEIKLAEDGKTLELNNGLISRSIRLEPDAATVSFDNLMTGESLLRGIKPEARVTINNREYRIGGLLGQQEYAYLRPEWIEDMTADPDAFHFVSYQIQTIKSRFNWKRHRFCEDRPWPPKGTALRLKFKSPAGFMPGLDLFIHYEIYDGIPLITKWLEIRNGHSAPVRLNRFTSEILALVEAESTVEPTDQWDLPNIHVESDYAFHGMNTKNAVKTSHWEMDPAYTSQVNYRRTTPCLLESRPPIGPDVPIKPGGFFESFRTYILVYDSTERERKGLSLRRMYRTIAPWVTENPIFMHLTSTDPILIKRAIDQCVEVGFEMVIISFGSGLDMENNQAGYLEKFRSLRNYAHEKGIELGGYSLLASRRISETDDVIHPETGRRGGAIFGNSPCLESNWGREYFSRITTFFENTGFDLLEHDGSYPGDLCASSQHPGHEGLDDSQWTQWRKISLFYQWCRGRGIYLNVPDWYFLSGSNKTGMGYREVNWSLPRQRQILLGRQNIYDGTWTKTPSMGWMFVPLVQYHGGGAAATLEPLSEHLPAYEAHLSQNFGSGVQACYRGPRLYDSDETRDLVKHWVDFYLKYRKILNSDIIHVRRPDGRDYDCILHANPALKERGLAMVYNPLDQEIERNISLPLYYTGLEDTARVCTPEGKSRRYRLDRQYRITVSVTIPARSNTWLLITE